MSGRAALRDYEARERASRNGPGGRAPEDRYTGRHVDLGPLLAAPPKPIPWRVRDLLADGTVTIVSGASGSGKSWLAQALCTGVARGTPRCRSGMRQRPGAVRRRRDGTADVRRPAAARFGRHGSGA
jgi:hypothetical protein